MLLVLAGVAKLRAPEAAVVTLRELRLPPRRAAGRVAGAAEIGVGAAAIALPGRLSFGLLALAYALLATVVAVLLARGRSSADCGCFGEAGGGSDRGHLLANLIFSAAAGALACLPPPGLDAATLGPAGLALAAGILAGALLVRAALTMLPSAWSAYGGRP
jgi:hypothetical protein